MQADRHLDRDDAGRDHLADGCTAAAVHPRYRQGQQQIGRFGDARIRHHLRGLGPHPVQPRQRTKQREKSLWPARHALPISASQPSSFMVRMPRASALAALDPAPGLPQGYQSWR